MNCVRLLKEEQSWPAVSEIPLTQQALRKSVICAVAQTELLTYEQWPTNFSSFQTIIAIIARLFRWRYPRPGQLHFTATEYI